jgi:hypothetical protein
MVLWKLAQGNNLQVEVVVLVVVLEHATTTYVSSHIYSHILHLTYHSVGRLAIFGSVMVI